ncbi:MAG: hypothetical protein U1F50_11570 [Rubrivivax sp.]
MPYYVYRLQPFTAPQKLAEFAVFRDASAQAKRLRGESGAPAGSRVKLIFADNELQAEDLLCQVRDAGPAGDE